MRLQELFEGDVVRDKFAQRLRSKKGMYKNPDIEVPEGYASFEMHPINARVGQIVGIRADGSRKVISTAHIQLADALASAYNAGGYTDKDIQKVPLSTMFRKDA